MSKSQGKEILASGIFKNNPKSHKLLKFMTVNFEDLLAGTTKDEDEEYERTKKEIARQDVYSELIRIFEKTVKEDRRSVEFIYTHLLSAYTPDPNNLGLEAPTSEGKTYPTVEIASWFPPDDVWFLGGLSPTSLVHDKAEFVDAEGKPLEARLEAKYTQLRNLKKTKADATNIAIVKEEIAELIKGSKYLVNMENKILIFLEAPQIETWEKLRPILSHDRYEISYKFTDKSSAGKLQTAHVVIRGWPAAIYLKAGRGREDLIWDQVQSRFTTISPKMGPKKYRAAIKFISEKKGLPSIVFLNKLGFDEFKKAQRIIRTIRRRLLKIKHTARKASDTVNPNIFWIPFYEGVGKDFPARFGRHMRDSARFFTLMQMSAATNVFARPILKIGGVEYIVVVREDYERAVRLFFEEAGEEIFSGLPAHVIDFFKEVLIPLQGETEHITVAEMVDKYAKKYEKPKSDNTIRERYLPPLAGDGLITGEPDPDDKRRKVWKVLRANIIPKNTPIYTLLENGGIFNRDVMERGWQELIKITHPEPRLHYENEITLDELWENFFSKPSPEWVNLSAQKDREKQERGDKNTPVPGEGVNKGISKPKEPQIEGIAKPTAPDLKARLFDTFGVNPFKPSQLPEHFTDDELVKLSAIMDDMRARGELVVTPLESGQMAFQLVRK